MDSRTFKGHWTFFMNNRTVEPYDRRIILKIDMSRKL